MLWWEGWGSVPALVHTSAEGQSAFNRGVGKVLQPLIDFLSLVKMAATNKKPAKYQVHAVLRFLMAKHWSAGAIHRKNCTVYTSVLWTKGYEL